MIPILYESNETTFATNGIGRLADCARCVVTEGRNEVYQCEFDYPVTGAHFEDITIGRIIAVTHDNSGIIEPFDIYAKTEPINGVVTFYANHISYRLTELVAMPYVAGNAGDAIAGLGTHSATTCPFTFATDKTTVASFALTAPSSIRSILGGTEGSILDVFGGGEYEFKRFSVILWSRRGTDRDLQIRYGSNLTDYTDEISYETAYNAVLPYWAGEAATVVGSVINSGESIPSGRVAVVPLDLSGDFEDAPTVAQLDARATALLANSQPWKATENLALSFVPLWQTEEYADLAEAQQLNLCDTALIYFPAYNKSARMKVVRVVYNTLTDRYDEMEFGELQTSLGEAITADLSQTIKKTSDEISKVGQIAGDTAQHFWFTETGTDTGAHITEVTKAEFVADPTNGGPNLLARTNGLAVRDGTTELAVFSASSARIGQSGQQRVEIQTDGVTVYTPDNETGLNIKTSSDNFSAIAIGDNVEQPNASYIQIESADTQESTIRCKAAAGDTAEFAIYNEQYDTSTEDYEPLSHLVLGEDVGIVSSLGNIYMSSSDVIVDYGVSVEDDAGQHNLIRASGGEVQIGAYGSTYANAQRVHINVRYHSEMGNTFQLLGRYTSGGSLASYAYMRAGLDSTSAFVKMPPVYSRKVNTRSVYVSSDGTLGTTSSSERWKHYIRRFCFPAHKNEKQAVLDGIRAVPVALFKYKSKHMGEDFDYDTDILGLIAEDVARSLPWAAIHNDEKPELIDDWDIRQVLPAVLLLAQEAMDETEKLKAEVETLKKDIEELKAIIKEGKE